MPYGAEGSAYTKALSGKCTWCEGRAERKLGWVEIVSRVFLEIEDRHWEDTSIQLAFKAMIFDKSAR